LGGAILFKTCAWLLRYVGDAGALIGSYLIAAGFLLAGGRTQYGMHAYWRRVRPHAGVLVHFMLMYRQYASFGRILCDRQLIYLFPESFRFTYRGGERIHAAVRDPRGCILLAAHLGNWELSSFRLRQIVERRVNLVMIRDDIPEVQQYVDSRMRGDRVTVIDPRDAIGASLAIFAALGRSETVCMLGDRTYGNQPVAKAAFLGSPARFPVGPFHAAAITGAPILIAFLVKTGARQYRLEVDEPWQITLPPRGPARTAELQRLVQLWAARLESQVRRFPLQWHNFFDFWQ
jgi:predicted LPLAT superfamily acyltransferase